MSGPGSSPPPPSGTWVAAPPQVGPAGLVYADVPNRAIAYIIDAVILFVINIVVGIVLGAVGLSLITANLEINIVGGIVFALVGAAINGIYFVYTWTTMRGSPGQRMLGMQVGNAADGANLTTEQAIKRWLALGAPFGVASSLATGFGLLGTLIGLAAFIWFIALLVTTAQSPTKQGLHDQYAKTIVVKAARSVT